VLIEVISVVPGDFNGNGIVDTADYALWRNGPNPTQANYTLWRSNYGRMMGSPPSSSSGTSVPEPTGVSLMFVSGLACLVYARSRSRSRVG
jgi:hypothetical protein